MKKYVLLGLAVFAILMFISLPVSAAYGHGFGKWSNADKTLCPEYQGGACINPDCPYDGIGPQDGAGMQYGRHSGNHGGYQHHGPWMR